MDDRDQDEGANVTPDIKRNPEAIWLSPICDENAHHGEGRSWAAPAPDETCEDCPEPWVRYVREDLTTPAPDSEKLREALESARDFIATTDQETGCCMCGSPTASHGMGDGHSPVDEGIYHANMIVEQIDAALGASA